MKSLITKTAGVADVLRAALEPLAGRISIALLYGSLARGRAGAESDIDLLIVGEVSFEEYRSRLSKGDHLLDAILKSPYMPVIGDPHESGRVAQ